MVGKIVHLKIFEVHILKVPCRFFSGDLFTVKIDKWTFGPGCDFCGEMAAFFCCHSAADLEMLVQAWEATK